MKTFIYCCITFSGLFLFGCTGNSSEQASQQATTESPVESIEPIEQNTSVATETTVDSIEESTSDDTTTQSIAVPDIRLVTVLEDLEQPVGIVPYKDGRLFIILRHGAILILDGIELYDEPFLDISELIDTEPSFELGLLGLAFDPLYDENGYIYVTHTDPDFNVHLARYTISGDPNIVDKSTRESILRIPQRDAIHNGGHLDFGVDGYLYMSIGDGMRASRTTAYYKDNLVGKILRIDVSGELPYTVPQDNPFVGEVDAMPEIWAYGLRNPWRFSFDSETNDMYIADVGNNLFEEINIMSSDSRSGLNYGWRTYEGYSRLELPVPRVPEDNIIFPYYTYRHVENAPEAYPDRQRGCAVIGGEVYRGERTPSLYGKYIFSDFCSGEIWALDINGEPNAQMVIKTNGQVTYVGTDSEGELFITTFAGKLLRLIDMNS